MPDQIDVPGMVRDPQFESLSPADKRLALQLATNDKTFGQLSDDEIGRFVYHVQHPANPAFENTPMKKSLLPGAVRMATGSLPIIGGMVGGAVGASAMGGFGAPIGAGLGAGAGETARQAIERMALGPQEAPDPLSREGLLRTGGTMAVAAASELPAAVAIKLGQRSLARGAQAQGQAEIRAMQESFEKTQAAQRVVDDSNLDRILSTYSKNAKKISVGNAEQADYGMALNRWRDEGLSRLSRSSASRKGQTGSVDRAISAAQPDDVTRTGLRETFKQSNKQLSTRLSEAYRNAPGVANVDEILTSARKVASEASAVDELSGVADAVDKAIASIKFQAGIKGSTATAEQLATFQSLLKKAYSTSDNIGNQGVVNQALRQAYGDVGGSLRQMSPEIDDVLRQMTDNHAALTALKGYVQPKAPKAPKKISLADFPEMQGPASAVSAIVEPPRSLSGIRGRFDRLNQAAAQFPRHAAVASPLATAAGVAGAYTANDAVEYAKRRISPWMFH